MLQIRTSVVASVNGSRKAVVGSGTTNISLSWISWKPRIDEPSNPIPSLNASASTALGGTEKCCQTPGRSVNRRSIIWTLLSLTDLRTSSAVAELRNICLLLHLMAVLRRFVATLIDSTMSSEPAGRLFAGLLIAKRTATRASNRRRRASHAEPSSLPGKSAKDRYVATLGASIQRRDAHMERLSPRAAQFSFGPRMSIKACSMLLQVL